MAPRRRYSSLQPSSTASLPPSIFCLTCSISVTPYLSATLTLTLTQWRGPFKRLPGRELRAEALMCLLFMLQHIWASKHKQVVLLLFCVVRFPMNAYLNFIMTGHTYYVHKECMRNVFSNKCHNCFWFVATNVLQSEANSFCCNSTNVKWLKTYL